MSRAWYVQHNGKTHGPVTSAQLKQLAGKSKITPQTKLRAGEDGDWIAAAKVKGLFPTTDLVKPKREVAPVRKRKPEQQVSIAPPPEIVVQDDTPQVVQKPCHYCGEFIAATAIKCRHCNEFLDGRPKHEPQAQPAPVVAAPQPVVNVTQVTNVGGHAHKRWSRLVAFLLSLVIPGLGQIYKGQLINGLVWFVLVVIGYVFIIPGLVLHVCCVLGAAMGDPYR